MLRYYADAGKLQVCMPNWTDNDGELKQGKTVALNLDAVQGSPEAMQLLEKILERFVGYYIELGNAIKE